MKVYIIRHPETEYDLKGLLKGHKDSRLSKQGRLIAEKLGNKLKNKNISKIYSSDLGRCLETSKLVNKSLQVQIISVPELRERNFGELNGKPVELVRKTLDLEDDDQLAPGGESFNQMRRRVLDFIRTTHSEKPILVVTHAGGLHALLSEAYNVNFTSKTCNTDVENILVFELENKKLRLVK